jgi:ferredoxin
MYLDADLERCCGSGMCALRAPALFDQSDDDGTVIVRQRQVPDDARNLAAECVRTCPSGAISVVTGPR